MTDNKGKNVIKMASLANFRQITECTIIVNTEPERQNVAIKFIVNIIEKILNFVLIYTITVSYYFPNFLTRCVPLLGNGLYYYVWPFPTTSSLFLHL